MAGMLDGDASTAQAEQDPRAEAEAWLSRFEKVLRLGDIEAACGLFDAQECFWRDLSAFTWNIVTVEGRDGLRALLAETLADTAPSAWSLSSEPERRDGVVTCRLRFDTTRGRGEGVLRLRDGRGWTLLTVLVELKGFEERAGRGRELGAEHGVQRGRRTWRERRQQEQERIGTAEQPYCLIVGGGQGGIGLAARLRRLGVPTLVIERRARPGDTWRSRYKSLCLHDPVWYDHLPYLPFPDDWPVFMPKDKLADWLEAYVSIMELNYWGSTTCRKAAFDEEREEWTVEVERDGTPLTLRPKQLVLALGVSGYPVTPHIPGSGSFEGEQLHSSAYASGAAYRGRHVVVVGSNNSAHDICADLWENEADVTMIQRSSTLIVRSATLMELAWNSLYSEAALEAGITTDIADLMLASMPHRIAPRYGIRLAEQIAAHDRDFYDRLRRAGFLLDFGEDGSGLQIKYLRRGSGYYIDVGASELICSGEIKLRSGVEITSLQPRHVVLNDGTELPADAIIYATGFGPINRWLADLISPEVARKIGHCWGLGSGTHLDPGPWEGELRNMWKPTPQRNLWFHGGNLNQSRFFSRTLALMIKARLEGIPTPVFRHPRRSGSSSQAGLSTV